MNKCAVCGSTDVKTVIDNEIYHYKGKSIAIPDFKKTVCNNCGEDFGDPDCVKESIPILRDFQRTIDGFLTSKEIKAIRNSFGYTQDEFSELLGGGAKAFARYENGIVLQSKPMDNQLKLLRDHPEAIYQLSGKPDNTFLTEQHMMPFDYYAKTQEGSYEYTGVMLTEAA